MIIETSKEDSFDKFTLDPPPPEIPVNDDPDHSSLNGSVHYVVSFENRKNCFLK